MKLLVSAMLCSTCLAAPAFAQAAAGVAAQEEMIVVTGSRIKRSIQDSPVPLTIISTDDLRREGIVSPEQFISYLTSNGTASTISPPTRTSCPARRGATTARLPQTCAGRAQRQLWCC